MSILRIKLNGDFIQELQLQEEVTYFGGRGEDCQIKLDFDKTFSRQHVKIYFYNKAWIVDCIAKYGSLFVNKESHAKINLNEHQKFSVPPYEFEYLSDRPSINPYLPKVKTNTNLDFEDEIPPENIDERTMTVIQTSHKKAFVVQLGEKNIAKKSFALTDEIFYVGRDPDNSIVLDHARVSRRQFKITRVADKFYLQDLGSINGTLLNGEPVSSTEPMRLTSGDIISILDFKIGFELRDPEFKQKFKQLQALAPLSPTLPMVSQQNVVENMNQYRYDNIEEPVDDQVNDSLNFFGYEIPLTGTNKMRIGIGLLLLCGLIFSFVGESPDATIAVKVDEKPLDPFSRLSQEDQNYIKHTYNLTKNLFMKGEYNLAHLEILKLHEKIPKYEDSLDLQKYITLAIEAQKQSELHDKIEKEKKESEEKIQNIVKHCNQLVTNTTTADELNDCLGPALELNPEHPDILSLKVQISKLADERVIKTQEKEKYNLEVKQLKDQYLAAMKLAEGDPLKGIPALDEIMNSTLPDPDKLKEQARRQKLYISGDIKNKTEKASQKAKSLAESGNFKEAIVTLEFAYKLDPANDLIYNEIEKYISELRKKMQVIYQEAIIDENVGNVESAKEKWKKIVELDVSNGEYYQKSQIKLKKYGLL